MIPVNVDSEAVCLKDIKESQFSILNQWYNQIEDFGFATGNKEISYLKNLFFDEEKKQFFLTGIYLPDKLKLIGVISGELRRQENCFLWIRAVIIEIQWQKKKYGTHAVRLLLGYMKKEFGIQKVAISVVRDNIGGVRFWESLGFRPTKEVKKYLKYHRKWCDVMIMQKSF